MKIVICFLKALLAIVSGLFLSFITVVGLEIILPDPNPFQKESPNLWLVGLIIAAWLFLMFWLVFRKWSGEPVRTHGIDQLPLSASELIDAVIEAMGYRKSVRAEVRQELTDHFTDALNQCQNEQERQKRSEELIGEFGDARVLGTLIRRGKKRCRPLWRTMIVRAFQAAGVLLVLFILYIGWFFTGKPVVTTNYIEVLNKMVRPAADESQNAGPLYAKAIESFVEPKPLGQKQPETADSQQPAVFDTSCRSLKSMSADERNTLEQWLKDNQQTIEWIRQGNTKPYFWRKYETAENTTQLVTVILPDLRYYKSFARLLSLNALWLAEQGNIDKSFESVFEGYKLAEHLRNRQLLIDQLVVIAMESCVTRTMRILLDEHLEKIEPAKLGLIRKEFAELISHDDFIIQFGGERLLMYDELQRSFTGGLGSHIYLQRINELSAFINDLSFSPKLVSSGLYLLFMHPGRDETLRTAEQCYNELDRFAELTPASLRKQGIDINDKLSKTVKGNVFLGMLTPAFDKVLHLSANNKAEVTATLTIMAIFEYQKKTGNLPASLNDLVKAGLLQQVPIDPYSDEPLIYRTAKTGFTLYSIGQNFQDDKGTWPSVNNATLWQDDGDAVFWPIRQSPDKKN